jgi:hypothetical protein
MSAKNTLSAVGVVTLCLTLAAGVAWAGSRGGATLLGFPILGWCAGIAFAPRGR